MQPKPGFGWLLSGKTIHLYEPIMTSSSAVTPQPLDEFLTLLSTFSGAPLQAESWLRAVLLRAREHTHPTLLADLAFRGAAVTRLLRTLRRQGAESEHQAHLEMEFSEAIHGLHEGLCLLFDQAPEEVSHPVHAHLLAVSETGLRALVDLAADLSTLKEFQRLMDEHSIENQSMDEQTHDR